MWQAYWWPNAYRTDAVLLLMEPLRLPLGLLLLPAGLLAALLVTLPPGRLPAAPPTKPVAPGLDSAGHATTHLYMVWDQPATGPHRMCDPDVPGKAQLWCDWGIATDGATVLVHTSHLYSCQRQTSV
jgi:hypothetical protein